MLPQIRDYDKLVAAFRWQIPARYNIGIDACDKWATNEPDRVALRNEGRRELNRALMTLSGVERRALLMAASGASGLEIAARLAMSHGATRAMMCRARARLRARAAMLPDQVA